MSEDEYNWFDRLWDIGCFIALLVLFFALAGGTLLLIVKLIKWAWYA